MYGNKWEGTEDALICAVVLTKRDLISDHSG